MLAVMDDRPETQRSIEYASPPVAPQRGPGVAGSPVVATLLCLPGVLCWSALLSAIAGGYKPVSAGGFLPVRMIVPIWALAVLSAVLSLVLYVRRGVRRPWYVWLNLAINVGGLLFTAAAVLLILLFSQFAGLD